MPIPNVSPAVAAAVAVQPSAVAGDGPAPVHDVEAANPAGLLECSANEPFVYVHYGDDPGNWFVGNVDGVNVWLPYLQQHPVSPGVSGVRTLRQNEQPGDELDEMVKKVQKRGGTLLPLSLGYRSFTECLDRFGSRGRFYHDAWSRPRQPKGRNKRTIKLTINHTERHRWLLSLIERGVIPAPAPELLDERIAQRASRIDRVEALTSIRADVQAVKIENAAAEAEHYESAAVPEMGSDVVADAPDEARAEPPKRKTPPRKRRTRKKPTPKPKADS